MDGLSIFNYYFSITEPSVQIFLGLFICALLLLIYLRPSLYVPLVLLTAPIPKLISVGVKTTTVVNYDNGLIVRAPGFSLVEPVIFCGACVALLRRGRYRKSRRRSSLGNAVWLYIASIAVSSLVGTLLYGAEYGNVSLLYAVRQACTLGCFFVAREYAITTDRLVLSRAIRVLFVSGNVITFLGLAFYYSISSVVSPQSSQELGSGVFRNFLFFFDLAYDFGFYLGLMLLVNMVFLLRSKQLVLRIWAVLGMLICPLAVLATGQRGNPVIVALEILSVTYLTWRQPSPSAGRQRLRQASLAIVALFAISLVVSQFAFGFERMSAKLDQLSGNSEIMAAEVNQQINLPPEVENWLEHLQIGDNTWRVAMTLSGLIFFLEHPLGIGYGREMEVRGFLSHHELVICAVEQGVFGVLAFFILFKNLRKFALKRPHGQWNQDAVLLIQCLTLTLMGISLISLTAITLWKFGFIYWTLLGVCDGVLRQPRVSSRPTSALLTIGEQSFA